MNRNNLWRFVIVILVVAWAVYYIYPPTNRDLLQVFRESATSTDPTFSEIIKKAADLNSRRPDVEYNNLTEAVGTNDIRRYFPQYVNTNELHPTTAILNSIQRSALGHIHLGIDLQGGVSFLVEMNTNNLASVVTTTNSLGQPETRTNYTEISGALSQAVEVLRKRVDQFGVAEAVVQPEGVNRISIQMPGASQSQMEEIRTTIEKVAYLEFFLVHPQSEELLKENTTLPGYIVMTSERTLPNGNKVAQRYLVKKKPEMIGGISSAWKERDNFGRPQIRFELDSAHSDKFAEITGANIGHQLAVVLDGVLQTAPVIQAELRNGGVITGDYTEEEATTLVNVLQNPLQAPVHIIDVNEVQPTLGKDTVMSGVKASIIGIIAVSLFMVCYYFLSGFIANVALITNVIILLGIIAAKPQTLTLPGIAGLVLTVGMAVDANVLIYERIREEKAKGKSIRGAVAAGYDRAFGTIFDSHVTTLISAIVLWNMGTGSIQGFGFSLTWGVAASLFTSLVVTRLIFDFFLNRDIIKNLRMLHLIPATLRINFMKFAVYAFIASWVLILIGNIYGFGIRGLYGAHGIFGVELTGGEKMVLNVEPQHKPDVEDVRKVATDISKREVIVAYAKNVANGKDTLQLTTREAENGSEVSGKIFDALKQHFPEANFGGSDNRPLSVSHEGAIVGEEIQFSAVLASVVALFGILFYVAIRYEFSFAVGAVIAVIHDVFMTLGWYFLAGRELNATTVAAVLTIIGFSINDTIVIFDRIREDLKTGVRGTFKEVMNQALNQTLSRTIITSGTVFLATLSLLIFGGGEINDFAFTFLIGIITGTYSSIYIASFIVLLWHKGQRPQLGRGAQIAVEANAPAR